MLRTLARGRVRGVAREESHVNTRKFGRVQSGLCGTTAAHHIPIVKFVRVKPRQEDLRGGLSAPPYYTPGSRVK